tara:strand:+ start:1282 stop:1545 length:264 start_codon:yes stop_codon:yes gene_type:complete
MKHTGRMLEENMVEFKPQKFSMEDSPCLVNDIEFHNTTFTETACSSDLSTVSSTETGVHKLFFSLDARDNSAQADWLRKLMSMQNPM